MNEIVSVIIPVLNAEKYIGGCFKALNQQVKLERGFEVILVDNGSTDSTLEIAEQYSTGMNLRIFSIPKVTIATLRNFGAKQARGDILAFLDADCIVETNWISRGTETFETEKRIGIAGAPYNIPPDSTSIAKAWSLNSSNALARGEKEWLPSGNMFIKKGVFLSIDGFNELLETNEDYDICQRLRENGYAVFLNPMIKSVHLGTPQGLLGFFKKELWHGKAVFRVFLNSRKQIMNLKAAFFALFYVFIILGLPVSLIITAQRKMSLPLLILITVGVVSPLLLSLIRGSSQL